ncbi:MAG: hypothetical protein AABW87_00225, partial [Nanoarchaeota archaeon]
MSAAITKMEETLSNYVFLEATDDHPNINIALVRLTLEDARPYLRRLVSVGEAGNSQFGVADRDSIQSLYDTLSKRAKEDESKLAQYGFLDHIRKGEAHVLLAKRGSSLASLKEFIEFLSKLRSDRVYDGNGKRISKSRLHRAYGDITAER